MRFAIVVAVHPERRSLDLVFTDTGLRVPEVQCLSGMAASDAGVWDIPSVPKPTDEAQAGALPKSGRQLVAAVDDAYGRPVVVGFLQPLAGQIAFTEDDRFVRRFVGGGYLTVAPDGSIELWHPSGTYARIGTGPHEKLAPISANKNWTEVTNAPKPTITLITPGASGSDPPLFSLVVGPDGTVTIGTQKAVNITATEGVNITANVAIHGNVAVTGGITATQDIVAGAVSLRHHVQLDGGGTGDSGPPVGG